MQLGLQQAHPECSHIQQRDQMSGCQPYLCQTNVPQYASREPWKCACFPELADAPAEPEYSTPTNNMSRHGIQDQAWHYSEAAYPLV